MNEEKIREQMATAQEAAVNEVRAEMQKQLDAQNGEVTARDARIAELEATVAELEPYRAEAETARAERERAEREAKTARAKAFAERNHLDVEAETVAKAIAEIDFEALANEVLKAEEDAGNAGVTIASFAGNAMTIEGGDDLFTPRRK